MNKVTKRYVVCDIREKSVRGSVSWQSDTQYKLIERRSFESLDLATEYIAKQPPYSGAYTVVETCNIYPEEK